MLARTTVAPSFPTRVYPIRASGANLPPTGANAAPVRRCRREMVMLVLLPSATTAIEPRHGAPVNGR
jgi:hypothetical protein